MDFYNSNKQRYEMNDDEVVVRYLWANNDDNLVMKSHGKALIKLRNTWYNLALSQEHGVHLNVRMRKLDIKVSRKC